VVGALAGDDTVLVVTPDAESAQELRRRLRGDAARWPARAPATSGDDTVLVVTPDAGSAQELRRRLRGDAVEQ